MGFGELFGRFANIYVPDTVSKGNSYLQRRLNSQRNRFDEIAGETVTYSSVDGSYSGTLLYAHPTLQGADEVIPGLSTTRIEHCIWAFGVDALTAITSADYLPQAGDIIERSDGEQYKLTAIGTGDVPGSRHPVYTYVTNARVRYLVMSIWHRRATS